MQMAFHFQMRNWAEVDRLLPSCVFLDAQTVSMKLARLYKTKDEGLDKFYKKKTRMLRKDSIVLPAATYSWTLSVPSVFSAFSFPRNIILYMQ